MGTFIRLIDYNDADSKEHNFFNANCKYVVSESEFRNAPGESYAYWINKKYLQAYEQAESIEKFISSFQGIISGNNDTLLRLWFEVNIDCVQIEIESEITDRRNWVPYNKGGEFRKWYGVQDYVINWKNGPDDKTRGRKTFSKFYFKEYAAWSYTVSSSIAMRYYQPGFLWDVRGSGIFGKHDDIVFLMGMISSKVGYEFFKIDSSVMSCQVENILHMPIINEDRENIISLVEENIQIAREEWNDFEVSWEFKHHPIIRRKKNKMGIKIEDKFNEYRDKCDLRFEKMKLNETVLNRKFISIYGLENEISPDVEDEAITLRKAVLEREIKSLLSYAVGCVMGRYSLKEDGLIYAGGEFNDLRYHDNFKPCEYGVIPITEEQFFESDLCTRVIDFIRVVYGEDTLADNLKFIANALKPDSYDSPKKIIRDYLFNGFFDNHYQIYQHRPIYWQLDSGKAGGFRAIVYMHRFNENTLPLVRTEYIQDLRYKYEDEMQRQQRKLTDAKTTAEKNAVKKEISSLDKKMVECSAYDDLLNHVTGSIQNYVFDLDDGVKNNYAKFLSIDGDKNKNILTVIKL